MKQNHSWAPAVLVIQIIFTFILSWLLHVLWSSETLFIISLWCMCVWQHELISWDITAPMKRSWKLLWGFAEPNNALLVGGCTKALLELAADDKILLSLMLRSIEIRTSCDYVHRFSFKAMKNCIVHVLSLFYFSFLELSRLAWGPEQSAYGVIYLSLWMIICLTLVTISAG